MEPTHKLRDDAETPAQSADTDYREIAAHEPPLVSIVTPSYQQGRFLRQCIESVLTQDYPHIEYLVFDGGSTDDSRAILESYNHRFFWKSEPDGGQTNAINAGLRRAKGTILAYLNSDDILLPGAVSAVTDAWRRRPEVDVFYGRANHIDEAGKILGEYRTREFDLESFKADCTICQPAAFWQRRVVERFGWFDEKFQTAMDYEYWQRIAANGGVLARLDRFLACSRDYAATKTRTQRGKVYEEVFKSQWRHWGCIGSEWWMDLFSYLKNERRGIWRVLGVIPASRRRQLSGFLSRHVRKRPPHPASQPTCNPPVK